MIRSFRSRAALALGATTALLFGCGPSTSLPGYISSCTSPKAVCFAEGSTTAQCIDLSSDVNNCGECGNACGVPGSEDGGVGTAACVGGACVPGCAGGLTVCGVGANADGGSTGANYCVDTTSDPNHCGSCGTRCLDTQVCAAGACVAAGQPGQGTTGCGFAADGGVSYVNLQTDRANCGACNNACGATEICEDGACDPCDVAQCNNVCVDTNHDVNNCGACGVTAPTCNNGVPQAAPQITQVALIGASGNIVEQNPGVVPGGSPGFVVSVSSGIRIASVTLTAKVTNSSGTTTVSNLYRLSASSDVNLSPSLWAFNWSSLTTGSPAAAMPTLTVGASEPSNIELDFTADDEQYLSTRSDAASHQATLTWTGQVAAVTPLTLVAPTATTLNAPDAGPLPTLSWVPLNGPQITLTETLAAAPQASSNIVGIEFHSVGAAQTSLALGGASSVIPFSGSSASITVNPADLGLGTRTIIPYQVDVFGNRIAAPAALTLTIGDITFYDGGSAEPVLAEGPDSGATIWLQGPAGSSTGTVCANAQVFRQPAAAPAPSPAQIGLTADSANTFCNDSFFPTHEQTGVFVVKSDGSSVARFDTASGETLGFIAAPSSGTTKFRSIVSSSITGAAMAINDTLGNGWFGVATVGIGDPTPLEAGGPDGGTFVPVPPVGGGTMQPVSTSTAGAEYAWIQVPTGAGTSQYQLDLFHPNINNNGLHMKSYLAGASDSPFALSVFPGGEYVWEESDANANLALGAGRFDGTAADQPIDLAGATVSNGANNSTTISLTGNSIAIGKQHTLDSNAFFVPSPGILVGLIPSNATVNGGAATSAGYEVVEIDFTASPAKVYHPQSVTVSTNVASGEVLLGGVSDRFGNFDTFTVSDDLKKVLYVTKATTVNPTRDTYSINLLDLASGTVQVVYSSPFINNDDNNNNGARGVLTVYPHFLHGVNSYAGLGGSSATPPIIVWGEELPEATAAVTIYQRLFYANYSNTPTPIQIDHLAYAMYQGTPPGLPTGALGGGSTAPFGGLASQLFAESVTANGIFFLSDDGGGELSLYGKTFDGGASATQISRGVTAWQLREDTGRQMIVRSDGAVMAGSLSSGGGLALSEIYHSDSGADTNNLSMMPVGGFTGDGNHVYVLDHLANTLYEANTLSPLDTGVMISLDLATGARTNWGQSVNYFIPLGAPSGVWLTPSASAFYGLDLLSNAEGALRLYFAGAGSGTTHQSIATTALGNNGANTSQSAYSLDGNEALFQNFTGGVYDLSPDRTTATTATTSFVVYGQAARPQPNFQSFGPWRLPIFALENLNGNGSYKAFGGGTWQKPITISAGETLSPASYSAISLDRSQYLGHFVDTANGGRYYVMALPGPGAAAWPALPQ